MIWELLVIYQLKHFFADYPLQGEYMLGKFLPWPKFIAPLAAHATVHGVFTFLIALYYKPEVAFGLALLDMAVHFTVDRIKASPSMLGRFKPLNGQTYKMSKNMSLGLGMMSGESMEDKLSPKDMEGYKALGRKDLRSNVFFWWALGWDQMMHHFTHYYIIWRLMS